MSTQTTVPLHEREKTHPHVRHQLLVTLMMIAVLASSVGFGRATAQAAATPAAPHLMPALAAFVARNPDELIGVIVQKTNAAWSPQSLIASLQGRWVQDLPLINGFAAQLPGHALVTLAQSPNVKWISPDAPVYKSDSGDGSTVTLREDFDGIAFQTQSTSASGAWASSPAWPSNTWAELGESDGANDGDIQIAPFLGGQYVGLRIQNAGKGLQTALNLSDATTATLALQFRRKDLDTADDSVSIDVSSDNGATWQTLSRLSGPATDESLQDLTLDLSAFAGANVQLRMLASPAMDTTDRVYVDGLQVVYGVKQDVAPTVILNRLFLPVVAQSIDTPITATMAAVAPASNRSSQAKPNSTDSTFTLADYFGSVSFCNQDGWFDWSGCWIENDPGLLTIGAGLGHVEVEQYSLALDDYPDTGGMPSIYRKASLLSAASAIVDFDIWTSNGVDAADVAVFEISTNNGASYTTLETYTGITGGQWLHKQYDLTRFVPNDVLLRFRIASGYGSLDEKFHVSAMRVWYDAVSNAQNWNIVVPSGAVWKYLDNGSNQGTAWRQLGFDDSAWKAGRGQLGYGENDEGTVVSYGPNSSAKYITTYFRRSFTIADVSNLYGQLNLGMVRPDDGIVIYLNGTEIYRNNMPNGTISYNTLASSDVWLIENDWIALNLPLANLVNGQNVIAAEVHQYNGSSNDLSFDAELAVYSLCGECISTANVSPYLKSIRADQVWNGTARLQGLGVTVAVVDSGIAPNSDLQSSLTNENVIARVNFAGGNGSIDDYNGHGSHIAGIIAGNGSRSQGLYTGLAPKAKLVDVKVLDDLGRGTMSSAINGLQWIYDNRTTYNIKVVNLSLNSSVIESYNTSPLDAALEILWFNKIVVVTSAGNTGTAALYPPGNDPFVITVGAVDDKGTVAVTDDAVATFSSYGTTTDGFAKPDLVAPGRNIISLLSSDDSNLVTSHAANAVSSVAGSKYFKMSGTSMASAVVAGAVALLLQDEPNLNPDQVKYRLKTTANTAWSGYTTAKAGAGILDIYAAVNGTSTATANTGIKASQSLFSGSTPPVWGSVNWSSVNWSSVNWSSVNWSSVNWSSVNWSSDVWP